MMRCIIVIIGLYYLALLSGLLFMAEIMNDYAALGVLTVLIVLCALFAKKLLRAL